MSMAADVVVIGAGHNGLACACYLARAGLEVEVLEAAPEPGGCIATMELPDGRGRIELGAYEHGGIRASGVCGDLELESRYGLDFHLRNEVTLAPCDDGSALPFYSSLERTVEALAAVVGGDEAEAYQRFSRFAAAAMGVLRQSEAGPPPSLRELSALADAALGSEGRRLVQTLLASASNVTRGAFDDPRLRGVLEHWAAHSQQPPDDPGTGAGVLFLAASHGAPSARPKGGSRATVDALVRCLEDAGGRVRTGARIESVEVSSGRARGVRTAGERIEARRAVVSQIDAKRLFGELVPATAISDSLRAELGRIHVGGHNVSELKVDAIIEDLPAIPGPPGFERGLMLSSNTDADIERGFARIRLGQLPERPTMMLAFPSALEPGWAPSGRHSVWLSTWVPWRPESGGWSQGELERAADRTWAAAERALGAEMTVAERVLTGPDDWVARNGNPQGNPNHVEMSIDQLLGTRPSPSLSRYRTPIDRLFLTGSGTHPGGGVTGIPGRNASAVVLEELGLRRGDRGARLRAQAALLRDCRPRGTEHEEGRVSPGGEEGSVADPLAMATAYQDSALIAAAVQTGIAEAIATERLGAEEAARRCGTDPRATLALLRALASRGLAESGEGFRLSASGAVLSRSAPDSIVEIVHKEWFFYGAWRGLPGTVRDGHARIGPWRRRVEEEPETALAFLRALDDLAARFGGELPELAGLDRGGRMLDVGGGAGSHAAALAAAVPGLEPTVLDLQAVEPLLRERHPEVDFVAGDLDEARFGRPEGERWDVVLLANILHDHPPERCRRYVAEASALLSSGGTLLIYEWLIGEGDPQPPPLAMFSLMMMVENEGGGTWSEAEIEEWVSAAGLQGTNVSRGQGPIVVLRAYKPGDASERGQQSSPVAQSTGGEE